MKVNLIGPGNGVGISEHLSSLLWKEGIENYINSVNVDFFDVNIICGLWHLDWKQQNFFKIPTIAMAVGSDVYRDLPELIKKNAIDTYLKQCDMVLMSHEAMRPYLESFNKKCRVWHIPFDLDLFPSFQNRDEQRDTLFYCSAPNHQDLNRILQYATDHPNKKCTLIGRGYQDFIMEQFENVLSIRYVPYEDMQYIYQMHKEYRQYYYRDFDFMSNMVCEALFCGLQVYCNDVQVKEIPRQMFPVRAMPRLLDYLLQVAG